jgi:hypothetical protein
VLACIELLPDLALQLLRMHLTKAVALAEKTVNIYSMPDPGRSPARAAAADAAAAPAAANAHGDVSVGKPDCTVMKTGCLKSGYTFFSPFFLLSLLSFLFTPPCTFSTSYRFSTHLRGPHPTTEATAQLVDCVSATAQALPSLQSKSALKPIPSRPSAQ